MKQQLGKLPLPEPAETYIPAQRSKHQIECIELDERSVALLAQLPTLHRDPFDRMLVCQAVGHGLVIVTGDPFMKKYPVSILQPT